VRNAQAGGNPRIESRRDTAQIVAGGEAFSLYAFDGKGETRWRTNLHDVINAVKVLPGGGALAATDSGVYELSPAGDVISFHRLPGAIAVSLGASSVRAAVLAADGTLIGVE